MSLADLAHHGAKFSFLSEVLTVALNFWLPCTSVSLHCCWDIKASSNPLLCYVLHSLVQTNHRVLCEVTNVMRCGKAQQQVYLICDRFHCRNFIRNPPSAYSFVNVLVVVTIPPNGNTTQPQPRPLARCDNRTGYSYCSASCFTSA